MSAEIKSDASFISRSLVWSRKIVEEGKVWRVGDGRDISVWSDKWVAGVNGPLKDLGEMEGPSGMPVSELLVQGVSWDEHKLNSLFGPFVRDRILNMSIGEAGLHDEMRWRHDPKGLFSVKSAYLQEIGYYKPDPHTSEPDRKLWGKLVWNVSIPPKAKVYLWRAFSNLIPTDANLKLHHVPTDGICKLCGDRWGSTEHCLLHCPRIVGVWKGSRFSEVVRRAKGIPLMEVAGVVFSEWGEVDYELWAMIVWQVWGVVCRLLHPDGERPMAKSEEL